MNEINLKITALSLAIDVKNEDTKPDDVIYIANQIYAWLSEGFNQTVDNVTHLKPIN